MDARRLRQIPVAAGATLLLLGGAASAAVAKPTASTRAATAVTPFAATLNGAVNGHGRATTFYFNYGLSSRYGLRTPKASAGTPATAIPVAASVSGLNPDTTYHFQVVAKTSSGTASGRDRSFRTPPIPTISTISVLPNPVNFGGLVSVSGALIGPPNEGGKQVALEANAFPFTAGFHQVGNTVVTSAQGAYLFNVVPLIVTTQLRVVDRSMPSVVSPVVVERVIVGVTLSARRARGRHRRGRTIRFEGDVAPAHPGVKVAIQAQRRNGSWRTTGTTLTSASSPSRSHFVKAIRIRGRHRYRAFAFVTDGSNLSGASASISVPRP